MSGGDEREALTNLIPLDLVHDRGREGFPQSAFDAADRILAAGFHRHPQPTGSEPSDAQIEAALAAWFDHVTHDGAYETVAEHVKDRSRPRMRAALRAARGVADQGRGNQ